MIHRQPVFERWLIGGSVLIDPVDGPGLLRLEGTAAALWEVLTTSPGGIDEDDLVVALATAYDTDADAIAADIAEAVERLIEHRVARRRA